MSEFDSRDPIWKMLRHASRTEAGPFFARDTVRAIRLAEEEADRGWVSRVMRLLLTPPAVGGALATAILVAGFFLFPEAPSQSPALRTVAQEEAFDAAEEWEEITYFGELVAVNDPADLTDEALVDLLF